MVVAISSGSLEARTFFHELFRLLRYFTVSIDTFFFNSREVCDAWAIKFKFITRLFS